MAITIDGSGSVTGISVGGLPDGIVDTDMLAASAVSSAKLASGAGGKVLQVASTTKTDTASASVAQGAVSSALISLSFAATSSSNKLVIVANINLGSSSNANIFSTLLIGGSASAYRGDTSDSRQRVSSSSAEAAAANIASFTVVFELSSPSTSSTVYGIGASHAQDGTETMYINRTHGNANANYVGRTASSLTIFEVAA